MNTRLLFVPALALAISACGNTPSTSEDVSTPPTSPVASTDAITDAEARAQAAIADLGKTLRGALRAKMEEGGPLLAVDFCHEEAQPLTAQVAEKHGVRIGRTALRLRNPANQPVDWQQAALEDFDVRAASGEAAASLRHSAMEGALLHYAQGIGTEPGCLACHGPQVAEPIADAIRQRYPDDQATGFAEGDLRGLFWVEVEG